MSYRTLEEKFLADFDRLENANKELIIENERLQAALSENSVNRVLDIAVKVAGRRKILEGIMPNWNMAHASTRDFEEWVIDSAYERELPGGVSMNDFITYFESELREAYEEKYAEDLKESE